MTRIYKGQRGKFTVRSTNNNNLTDTTVTATVEDPAGTETSPDVSTVSTGIYTFSVLFDRVGEWHVKVTSDGDVDGADYVKVTVRPTPLD